MARQDWLRTGKINILVQYGEHSRELPNVPFAVELAKNSEDRALLAFYVSSEQIGRAFLAPPGIPAQRVSALGHAYDETMRDPQFLVEIEKSRSEFKPLPGDQLQELVARTTSVSGAITTRVRKILGIAQ